MKYDPLAIELAKEFMTDDKGSYSKLATYLELFRPRENGPWTKHSAYHLCRTNGISSSRRCKNQPAAGEAQRNKTRCKIITATISALSSLGKSIADIAPAQAKVISQLSGASLITVRNNWDELEDELNSLAGL